MILHNCKIYTFHKIIENGWIKILDNKIAEIHEGKYKSASHQNNVIDLEGNLLIPGFIEVHTNGSFGYDLTDNDLKALPVMMKNLPKDGVTSCLVTIVTSDDAKIKSILKKSLNFFNNQDINDGQTFFNGIYLEGPYINPITKGAHEEKLIRPFSESEILEYQKISNNLIKILGVATEYLSPKDLEFLKSNNIIATVAHSNDTAQHVLELAKTGNLTLATHLFNGMSPFHHRHPGVVNGCLSSDNIITEIITDGFHVNPLVLELTYKIKGKEKICVITDATKGNGSPDGDYTLGNLKTYKKNGAMYLASNPEVLAGSAASMIHCFKTGLKGFKCSIQDMIEMISYNPAKIIQMFDKTGSIETGKWADLIVLDKDNLDILKTIVRGKIAYTNN
ncbi:N-acetylglucosamine-6-phosphate deacetylase [Mycoplasma sp. SG1]|uniref:N-acetylglucosamine-6-phosphate deacetylase n=1 Tax=Mycoplasma sp. SG1 TaxID=2810348 RepID=UPI002025A1FD|nr:N-acetylglucosamine-6-phosphate deacetylase [Mycoplasma sp. SG1]URM52758.1 N-acetylglucosamine-6-phosphate deacetylase [Mycoplasma sp. SG1]